MHYRKVLVTGGSGFVGRRLRHIKPDWIYVSSKQADLADPSQCEALFRAYQPDAVVHLAARVGGIKANVEHPADFLLTNVMVNTNVVESCRQLGVKRLLSSLSTCAYPDVLPSYPYDEKALLDGPPPDTNLPYAYAKRLLYVQTNAYRQQYGLNYSTFCPTNIYGPEDNFDLDSCHVVAAIVRKITEAADGDTVELWGTGKPLRQHLYVDDLAQLIPQLLILHNTDMPVIVAPDKNLSIAFIANTCVEISQKKLDLKYNEKLEGQYRKDGSNKYLLAMLPGLKFTPLYEGLQKTYQWYNENRIHNWN